RSSLLSRGAHDDLGVFDPIDHPAKDRVLLIKSRLLFQRNEPLAVRAVDILSARRADSAALVGNVAEFSRHVRIRRVARAVHGHVASFGVGITALNDSQAWIYAMNC